MYIDFQNFIKRYFQFFFQIRNHLPPQHSCFHHGFFFLAAVESGVIYDFLLPVILKLQNEYLANALDFLLLNTSLLHLSEVISLFLSLHRLKCEHRKQKKPIASYYAQRCSHHSRQLFEKLSWTWSQKKLFVE